MLKGLETTHLKGMGTENIDSVDAFGFEAPGMKLLLVEDNESDARLVEAKLEASSEAGRFELVRARSLGEAVEFCGKIRFAVILLDLGLSDSFGIETLASVLKVADCAVIVLSGMNDEELAINALSCGAQDYLRKDDLRGSLIGRSIRYAIERFRLGQDLERENAKAEAASRAKSEFLMVMSHEFRTPMNGIVGGLEILKSSPDSETTQEVLEMMGECAHNQIRLINNVLDLSGIESASLNLEFAPVSVEDLLRSVVSSLRHKFLSKGIEISTAVDEDVPVVCRTDGRRLYQVLLNVMDNAAKFTSEGEVTVRVCSDGADRIRFSVQDTGIGIEAASVPTIFESFKQVDSSRDREFQGAGLGLAISQRLVALLGGRMWVESEFGVGSTFHFEIKDGHGALLDVTGEFADRPAPRIDRSLADSFPLRVLVVDDNVSSRFVLAKALGRMGYSPDFAGDGEEAISKATEKAYDLILMDLQLPKVDGLEATRRILKIGRERRTKPFVSAMKSSACCELKALERSSGLGGVVTKPILDSELEGVIRIAFANREDGSSLARKKSGKRGP